jgi:hypothetical protein
MITKQQDEISRALEKLVFTWLDTIKNGTNKPVVKKLLTPKGISYTFDLSKKDSQYLFKKWQKK